jgi:hypothetical protein
VSRLQFKAFVGHSSSWRELGWISVSGEIYTTTSEDARAFAGETTVVVDRKTEAALGEAKTGLVNPLLRFNS